MKSIFWGVDFEEGVPGGGGRGELENSLLARETEEGRGRTFGVAGGKKEFIMICGRMVPPFSRKRG